MTDKWCSVCGYKRAKSGDKCAGCRSREYRNNNPVKAADQAKKDQLKKFGVDDFWYDQKFKEQDGKCAICRRPESARQKGKVQRLAVDHDHRTNQPRALLCAGCNRGIGLFGDDPDRLEAAARYLRLHQESEGTSELKTSDHHKTIGPES